MKLRNVVEVFFLALLVSAVPLVGFGADEKNTDSPLMEPVKSVLDNYLGIQKEMAKDSLKGLAQHSSAIAKVVGGDEMKMLPMDVAKQADALSQTKDLKTAREDFKPLSASLICGTFKN